MDLEGRECAATGVQSRKSKDPLLAQRAREKWGTRLEGFVSYWLLVQPPFAPKVAAPET